MRARIATDVEVNTTGSFRCPMHLFKNSFIKAGGCREALLPFLRYELNGTRLFSSLWNTYHFERYATASPSSLIVLVEIFIDGTTLSKSGSHSAVFFRVRFSNLWGFTEKWLDVAIAPSMDIVQYYLPSDRKRSIKLQLLQSFIFLYSSSSKIERLRLIQV